MIADAIMSVVTTVVSYILGLLPQVTVTFPTASLGGLQLAFVGSWNTFLPLSELLTIVDLEVTVILPAVLTYKVANWIWRHIPDIGGFGPGSG